MSKNTPLLTKGVYNIMISNEIFWPQMFLCYQDLWRVKGSYTMKAGSVVGKGLDCPLLCLYTRGLG